METIKIEKLIKNCKINDDFAPIKYFYGEVKTISKAKKLISILTENEEYKFVRELILTERDKRLRIFALKCIFTKTPKENYKFLSKRYRYIRDIELIVQIIDWIRLNYFRLPDFWSNRFKELQEEITDFVESKVNNTIGEIRKILKI